MNKEVGTVEIAIAGFAGPSDRCDRTAANDSRTSTVPTEDLRVEIQGFQQHRMVLRERIELSTSPLPRECSTTELPQPPDAALLTYRTVERKAKLAVPENRAGRVFRHGGAIMLAIHRWPERGWDMTGKAIPQKKDRKARLAEELRANLQKRKAQSRSRRTGKADQPDGLGAAKKEFQD